MNACTLSVAATEHEFVLGIGVFTLFIFIKVCFSHACMSMLKDCSLKEQCLF